MKWVLRGLIGVVAAIVLLVAGGYFWLRGSLPDVDGEIELANLERPIEIVRDRHGVPHIFAETRDDAAFGLGFVHAQDRLWQMEMNRRIGAGRLSEALGAATVGHDVFLRTLGLRRHAIAAFDKFEPETRAMFDAYTAGVNAFLEQRSGPLPLEFLLVGIEPEPWTVADSLTWTKVMALDLAANWTSELLRYRLADRLSDTQLSQFFAPYGREGLRGVAAARASGGLISDSILAALWDDSVHPLGEGAGSNNWVVGGSRTATGKPLLANDPHLGLTVPSVWYFAHLSWPDNDLIGATFPGLPSVVLGRNRKIAWGFTNTNPDVQDLYVERLDPDDPNKYMAPGGSRAFETRQEIIKVKDGEDIVIDVRETRHGPVISDASRRAASAVPEDHVLSLAWTALRDDDMTAQGGLKLALAQNWAEFKDALTDFHGPQQNIVYADIDGNIGFAAPARVPVRKRTNRIKGMMPQPGWDATYDWTGFIPFDDLPRRFNPRDGMIATANHKIVRDDYPYHLTYEWADDYRVRRIRQLLVARDRHSIESFKALQADVTSLMAQELLPRLLRPAPRTETARRAHARLSAWDGVMRRDAAEPLIFSAWYRELTRLIYADELGDLFQGAWRKRVRFVRNVLENGQDIWCNEVPTDSRETCDEQIVRALELAMDWIAEHYGDDPEKWRWGDAHYAHGKHRPFSQVSYLARLFDIKVPTPGGTYTVNVGQHRLNDAAAPFANVHAASLRAIYDLDDPDRSLFMHSTGQSGNILSPLYRNFAEPWSNGEYLPMTTRRSDFEPGAMGTLILRPN